jgi:hypothetical protein
LNNIGLQLLPRYAPAPARPCRRPHRPSAKKQHPPTPPVFPKWETLPTGTPFALQNRSIRWPRSAKNNTPLPPIHSQCGTKRRIAGENPLIPM